MADPLRESMVQALESKHEVGQLPSQSSMDSMMEFPQMALQSSSLLLLHPEGQHPSPFKQAVMSVKAQAASHEVELPPRESVVQAIASSQEVGQFPSQISPASTMLLAQTGAQSASLRLLQPAAQQPSPEVQVIISVFRHSALQVLEEPSKLSMVHAFWSEQLVGQSPSQSSPISRSEFPQMDWQSLSERESQPAVQQPSLLVQVTMTELEH